MNPTPYRTIDNTNRCNLWTYFLQNTVIKTDNKCIPKNKGETSGNNCSTAYRPLSVFITMPLWQIPATNPNRTNPNCKPKFFPLLHKNTLFATVNKYKANEAKF